MSTQSLSADDHVGADASRPRRLPGRDDRGRDSGGFLTKEEAVEVLLEAIRCAARGEVSFTGEQRAWARRWREEVVGRWESLTRRERDVLRLLAAGSTNFEIAQSRGLSHKTVVHHVSNVLKEPEVDSRTEAAVWAVQEGLIEQGAGWRILPHVARNPHLTSLTGIAYANGVGGNGVRIQSSEGGAKCVEFFQQHSPVCCSCQGSGQPRSTTKKHQISPIGFQGRRVPITLPRRREKTRW